MLENFKKNFLSWLNGHGGYSFKNDFNQPISQPTDNQNKLESILSDFENKLNKSLAVCEIATKQSNTCSEISMLLDSVSSCIDKIHNNIKDNPLEHTKNSLIDINNDISKATVSCNSKGIITSVNKLAEELFDCDIFGDTLVGKSINEFFSPEFIESISDFFKIEINQLTRANRFNPNGQETKIFRETSNPELVYITTSSLKINNEIFVFFNIKPYSSYNMVKIENRSLDEIVNSIPECDGAIIIRDSKIVRVNKAIFNRFCNDDSDDSIKYYNGIPILKVFPLEVVKQINNYVKERMIGKVFEINFNNEIYDIFIEEFIRYGNYYKLIRVVFPIKETK